MKPGLSKREKVLLFTVGLVAILYFSIQFAILPLATRYTDGINERNQLTAEKEAHQLEAATLPSLRERNAEAHTNFEELTSGYPKQMPNEEIDSILTTMCTGYSLSPNSLRFAPREAPPPPPPPPTQPDTVRYQDDVPEPEEPVVEAEPTPIFTKATAFMNVTGGYHSLLRLIDEVNRIEYIRLTNVGYQENSQAELAENSTISLTFEVTMLYD